MKKFITAGLTALLALPVPLFAAGRYGRPSWVRPVQLKLRLRVPKTPVKSVPSIVATPKVTLPDWNRFDPVSQVVEQMELFPDWPKAQKETRVSAQMASGQERLPEPDAPQEFSPDFIRFSQGLFYPGMALGGVPAVASSRGRGVGTEGVAGDKEQQDEVALSPLTNEERENVIASLFIQAGAGEVIRQPIGDGRNNVIAVKKGSTDKVIVVGGHYDKVRKGRGTIDNWTGATMTANLYQAFNDVETEHTLVFIAFGREEEGLVGSQRYVESLSPQQRKNIAAMINLDTLGVDGTYSWKNNSTRSLLDFFMAQSKKTGLGLEEIVLWGGDSDSSSFKRIGRPAMTLFGASEPVIWEIIHSDNDTVAYFSLPHYKNSYLLTRAVVEALDRQPPSQSLNY